VLVKVKNGFLEQFFRKIRKKVRNPLSDILENERMLHGPCTVCANDLGVPTLSATAHLSYTRFFAKIFHKF
jgi:hypothetical protein